MYIFAKFVLDHIFSQNRDKLNIKNLWQRENGQRLSHLDG
jgi:hypothetical protein